MVSVRRFSSLLFRLCRPHVNFQRICAFSDQVLVNGIPAFLIRRHHNRNDSIVQRDLVAGCCGLTVQFIETQHIAFQFPECIFRFAIEMNLSGSVFIDCKGKTVALLFRKKDAEIAAFCGIGVIIPGDAFFPRRYCLYPLRQVPDIPSW